MRIAVVGAAGRTGRAVVQQALARGHEVIAIARHPPAVSAPRAVEWRRADAQIADEIRAALAGADAVAICLGPRGVDDETCAPATLEIVRAMHAHGIRRVACVTGAMIGAPPERLGWVLRRLRTSFRRRHPHAAADRTAQERILEDSGLAWTIVRPARLARGGRTRALVAEDLRVPSLATSRRADVAAALLDAVEHDDAGRAVTVLSRPPLDRRFVARWAGAYAIGETLGLGLVATLFTLLQPWLGAPFVAVAIAALAGVVEGTIVGGVLGAPLTAARPQVRLRTWVLATITGAVIAWVLASIPMSASARDTGVEPVDTPTWFVLVPIALGAAAGPMLAFFQLRALRVADVRARTWILANSAGWAVAMPLMFLAWDLPVLLLVGGAAVGVITGAALAYEDRHVRRGTKGRSPGARNSRGATGGVSWEMEVANAVLPRSRPWARLLPARRLRRQPDR